jgi:membrane protein insertase Oxa1/YidC/SpoIIIJ
MAAPNNFKKEPNKYAKNKDIQADTLLKTLSSVGGLALVLIGILGIAMEFFKDGGWLKTALSWLFDSTTHMMFIPVIIFALWLFNRWMTSSAKGEKKKSGDVPMYIMMAIGAFYVFRFITTGGF